MRLGPALLVALLPLIAGANFTASSSATSTFVNVSSIDRFGNDALTTVPSYNVDSVQTSSATKVTLRSTKSLAFNGNGFSYSREYESMEDEAIEHFTTETSFIKKENLTAGNLKTETASQKTQSLTVGYLTAVKGDLKLRQGLTVSGALTMALNKINNDTNLLPNVRLNLRWNDTKGETVLATRAMTDMICDGVAAFIGPEGSCHVEAIVAQSRNIPMISYKCSDYKASTVPTFARTEPPDTQVTKSVLSLLRYYSWKKFAIVYEEPKETVAKSLESEARKHNMTINDIKLVGDKHNCCERDLNCCQSSYWYQIIHETKNRTRIYVFLGNVASLIDLMTTMQTAQLFDKGEYIVIYVDWETYSDKQSSKYLWKPEVFDRNNHCEEHQKDFKIKGQSLFVIVPTAPTEKYEQFMNEVREYNKKEPFNFATPNIFESHNYQKYVPIHAAYLYDSVMLYAQALDKLIDNERLSQKARSIEEIASNGTEIIKTIIGFKNYESITGATMEIDANGDSEGNFSVLALQYVGDNGHIHKNFSCDFQMRPVAQFLATTDLPVYQINKNVKIEWPNGNSVPNDEPSCGFNNEMCSKSDTHLNSIIAAAVLAVLLFCAGVITMSIYRKWKIEQEIEGLLWKIDRTEIHGYFDHDIITSPSRVCIITSPSRMSLGSASATSYESRGGAQVFAMTAHFRGVMVRIKELTFSKKKDISRDIMKEMRLLRELRHDNINSFIGACVEPMSLLLVTDYCAKGSLYDIIENEDIKLDKMFVASLVHDLIKGMLYIHNSMLICHGNLKSSNCVVTSRWVLQVTDFGLADMRHCAESDSIGEHQYYRSLFWKAPELLRNPSQYIRGTPKGDVYAFAIILYEIIGRRSPPFGNMGYEPKDIIELVKHEPQDGEPSFRPELELLLNSENGCEEYVMQCIKDCWSQDPDSRPDFPTIRTRLKKMKEGKNRNIMDQMMEMMVKYANHLEELVQERTRLLNEEKMKTVDLLHRMLPKPVAERLTMGYGIEPEWFDPVTIYFSDIVGFTAMSAESTPLQVVNFLNDLYTVFDRIIKGYDVYKVETIGDAYMVVSGLPVRNGDKHAGEIASMALELLAAVKGHSIPHRPKETLKLRIGIHTGPVVAGVVGLTMPRYCLFGDTVNTASRMESNGEPLKIHISLQCKEALEKLGGYCIEDRGLVHMKGKGEVRTFWLVGATERAIQKREVDLGELPPLFCRPRRSPKLNNDSRQASFCDGMGGLMISRMISRRHSSVPRGTSVDIESSSTLYNSSPVPNRHINKFNRNALHVPDIGYKETVNSTFGSQVIEVNDLESRKGLRPRRVLSSIASSCDEPSKSQGALNKVRESKSLDPLPLVKTKNSQIINKLLKTASRSTKSLENCDKYGNIQIIAMPEDKLLNNNFPNGNIIDMSHDDNVSLVEDVQVPLLHSDINPTIVHRKRLGSGTDEGNEELISKRWRSLETVRPSDQVMEEAPNKKNILKPSIKNWLVGLFNGNGLKASNTVLNEFNNLQTEKESIV